MNVWQFRGLSIWWQSLHGVNDIDSPALKKGGFNVDMGIAGSEVSYKADDMIIMLDE